MRYHVLLFAVSTMLAPLAAEAQTPSQGTPRLTLPPVTVTAQKEPADRQDVPISVTAVPKETLWDAKVTAVSEASVYAPNVWFNEFSVRKLSNAFFRGIGSSPNNPGVTTYIDGVPQLNANASNIEFSGVGQVEFVRGAQSALFGRNSLGGVINIASERPSLTGWTGNVVAPFGDYSTREVRAAISGPINDRIAFGASAGRSDRDGFTVNTISGNSLDSREATFGKAQVLFVPSSAFEARVIVSGERARDGDYALSDLAGLRERPFETARDFEGRQNRDLFNTTLATRYERTQVLGHDDDRLRELGDRGHDRSRLLAAARGAPQQRRRGLPVHPGSPPGLRGGRTDRPVVHGLAQVAGRRVLLLAELRSARGQQPGPVRSVAADSILGGSDLAACGARGSRHRPLRPGHRDVERAARCDARAFASIARARTRGSSRS